MKKSLLLLVTLFTALFAGAETIDNKTATWTAAGDGLTLTSGTYTLTASKATGKTVPAHHKDGDIRVYAKGTLTVTTTGANMKSIVFNIAKTGIYVQADMSASTGTVTVDTTAMTVTWTGDANNVVLTVGDKATYGRQSTKNGQFRFIKAEITANGTSSSGETGGTQTATEMTIASLNALTADQANVRLKFTNAKVLGSHTTKKGAKSIYVREGDKAIILFNTGLELNDNAVLNGYVDVDFKVYNGMPEVVKNAQTSASNLTVTESTEEAMPVETTIAELNAKNHLADLVVLKGVTIESEQSGKYTNYYAVSGSDRIQLFGGVDVKDYVNGKKYDVVAIFNQIFKGTTPEIAPTKVTEATATGISTIQEAQKVVVYDLQGRRVQKAEKGLFIINGKKVLVK
mgnify:FL=1|nr:hypothetical protein [uncultured Alloprevotella sp.]